ncbi:hypothetical protein MJ575_07315 [Klebsiella pneumoniae]|nr:hypothetical protein MJ575_07315 [Klebsiella pneumoniae]
MKNLLGDRVKSASDPSSDRHPGDRHHDADRDEHSDGEAVRGLWPGGAGSEAIFELNPAHQLNDARPLPGDDAPVRRMGGTAAGSGAARPSAALEDQTGLSAV